MSLSFRINGDAFILHVYTFTHVPLISRYNFMEHTSNVENGANLKLTITNGIATLKPTTVKACAGNRSGSKWDKGERDRARARERERDTVNEWVWTVIFDSALQSNSNTWIWCETKLFRFNDWLFPSIDTSLWEESEKKRTHTISTRSMNLSCSCDKTFECL